MAVKQCQPERIARVDVVGIVAQRAAEIRHRLAPLAVGQPSLRGGEVGAARFADQFARFVSLPHRLGPGDGELHVGRLEFVVLARDRRVLLADRVVRQVQPFVGKTHEAIRDGGDEGDQ